MTDEAEMPRYKCHKEVVVYADGYKSFSPAQAFEEGYTKV